MEKPLSHALGIRRRHQEALGNAPLSSEPEQDFLKALTLWGGGSTHWWKFISRSYFSNLLTELLELPQEQEQEQEQEPLQQ